MKRLVAVTLSLIMTMATVSEAGAAAFTSPDTAPAVATQTDAEEVNVTEETSETEADAFSDGDDGTAVPSQEQTMALNCANLQKIRIQQIQMIRKQQQQHYPMRRCCLRLTDSQEIRQNHLKQQWLKQIQQL